MAGRWGFALTTGLIAVLALPPATAATGSAIVAPATVAITEYTGVSGALGITAGPDGAVWFIERGPGKVGVISTSGAIAEFTLPNSGGDPRLITVGPDGALWFTEGAGNQIGRITTAGTITEFSIPSSNASAVDIVAGPDGALWFTESNGAHSKIGRITTAGVITEFSLPSATSGPNGIAAGPDGALWFTEYWDNKIGRITTAGDVTEFNIPTAASGAYGIAAGADGALWFTEGNANKIGRITTAGAVTEYNVPTPRAAPSGIVAGPDGAIWFTETSAHKLGRITTAGTISEFTIASGSSPSEIAVGPDGALWFTANTRIGRAQLPMSRTGILSHIAAGASWGTTITLVNNSSATVPVTVRLRFDDGSDMVLPLTVTEQGAARSLTDSSVDAIIAPHATVLVSMGAGVSSTQVGWAEVLSPGPVCGFAIFRTVPASGPASEGTVPLQTEFSGAVVLPYDNTAGFVMGLAVANLSSASTSVTAAVWDESGVSLGTHTLSLAGNGHASFALPDQFTLTRGRRGVVRLQSSAAEGLAGLGLRFSALNTFTSVPTM